MKKCPICLKVLSEDNFYKNRRTINGLQSYCKSCSKNKRIQTFKKNIEQELQTRKIYSEKQKQKYIEYKKTLSCNICKENRWYVLDFHHIDDNKENNVTSLANGRFSWETILQEIKKCEVLCANCHREKHFFKNKS
jgi:hypothetical protein